MIEPFIFPSIIFSGDEVVREYSELFNESGGIAAPIPGDGRQRELNYSPQLPPVMKQYPLGCCVASSLAAIKAYHEFVETGRTEQTFEGLGPVKKSTHYLFDQRLIDTHCELYSQIPKNGVMEEVTVNGEIIEGEVVEVSFRCGFEGIRSIDMLSTGIAGDRTAYIFIGGERFLVVDDSVEYFFSRSNYLSGSALATNDDSSILPLSQFNVETDTKNKFLNSALTMDAYKVGKQPPEFGIQVNRENAIIRSLHQPCQAGIVAHICTQSSHRIELELSAPTKLKMVNLQNNSDNTDKSLVKEPSIETYPNVTVKWLSRFARFEYAKVRMIRIDEKTSSHKTGSNIQYFTSGWMPEPALDLVSNVGIVDEVFWPFRAKKYWKNNVKEIPFELLKLGGSQTIEVIGRGRNSLGNYYPKHALKLSINESQSKTVQEMIHALENVGPVLITVDAHQYSNYKEHRMEHWKPSTDPSHIESSRGGHALVIIGFKYSINPTDNHLEGGFLIRNSWGPYDISDEEGTIGKKLRDDFGNLKGHTRMDFSDWNCIKSAHICKDGVNQLPYAPETGQKEFYFNLMKDFCNDSGYDTFPDMIPSDEVLLLAIRGWRYDRPGPEFKNRYSDTIVVINNNFEITTFIASTRPSKASAFSSNKGWPHLAKGVYQYNFDKITLPECLVPSTSVMVQYDLNGKEDTDYKFKEESNKINISAGGLYQNYDTPVDNSANGNQVIAEDVEKYQSFEEFMALLTTNHTKKQSVLVKDLTERQRSMFSDEEKKGFIDDGIQEVDVPTDIIYALIDSDEVIQYVENSQNGGGN